MPTRKAKLLIEPTKKKITTHYYITITNCLYSQQLDSTHRVHFRQKSSDGNWQKYIL